MSAPLQPERQPGVFAFVCVAPDTALAGLDVVATMREREGLTLVLPEEQAAARGFRSGFRCAWITLRLDSALEACGLTASFARALAERGIACNVVAGLHHDHLFVPVDRADEALERLATVSWSC